MVQSESGKGRVIWATLQNEWRQVNVDSKAGTCARPLGAAYLTQPHPERGTWWTHDD